MQWSDYNPIIIPLLTVAGVVIGLRIFFTLWGPVDRFFNGGGKFTLGKGANFEELRNKRVNIQLKNNTTVAGVVLLGVRPSSPQVPYFLRQFLAVRFSDGRVAYFRADEIAYLEEASPATP